jgi:hypothetical protein
VNLTTISGHLDWAIGGAARILLLPFLLLLLLISLNFLLFFKMMERRRRRKQTRMAQSNGHKLIGNTKLMATIPTEALEGVK